MSPIIFNNLHVANWIVRFNAISALAISFPLYDSDIGADRDIENARQVNLIVERCGDDHPTVRESAIDASGRILERFWEILSSDSRMSLLSVLERSTRDRSSNSIRLAAVNAYKRAAQNLLASSSIALSLTRLTHTLFDPHPPVVTSILNTVREMVTIVSVESVAKQLIDSMLNIKVLLSRVAFLKSRHLSQDLSDEQYQNATESYFPSIQFVLHTLYIEPTRTDSRRQALILLELAKESPLGLMAAKGVIGKVIMDTPATQKALEEFVESLGGYSEGTKADKKPVAKRKAKAKGKSKAKKIDDEDEIIVPASSSSDDEQAEEIEVKSVKKTSKRKAKAKRGTKIEDEVKEDNEEGGLAENQSDENDGDGDIANEKSLKRAPAAKRKRVKISTEEDLERMEIAKRVIQAMVWGELGVACMRALSSKSRNIVLKKQSQGEVDNEQGEEDEEENNYLANSKKDPVKNLHSQPTSQWSVLHVLAKIAAFLLKPLGNLLQAVNDDPTLSLGPAHISSKLRTLFKEVKTGSAGPSSVEAILRCGPLADGLFDVLEALKTPLFDEEIDMDDMTTFNEEILEENNARKSLYKFIEKGFKSASNNFMLACSDSPLSNSSDNIDEAFDCFLSLASHPLCVRWGLTWELVVELLDKLHSLAPRIAVAAGAELDDSDIKMLDDEAKTKKQIETKKNELKLKAVTVAEQCLVSANDGSCALLTRSACRCSMIEALVSIPHVRKFCTKDTFVNLALTTKFVISALKQMAKRACLQFPTNPSSLKEFDEITNGRKDIIKGSKTNSADSLDPVANTMSWPGPYHDTAIFAIAVRIARMGLRIVGHHELAVSSMGGAVKGASKMKKTVKSRLADKNGTSENNRTPLLADDEHNCTIEGLMGGLIQSIQSIDISDVFESSSKNDNNKRGNIIEDEDEDEDEEGANKENENTDESELEHSNHNEDSKTKKMTLKKLQPKKQSKAKPNPKTAVKRVKAITSDLTSSFDAKAVWSSLQTCRPLSTIRGLSETIDFALECTRWSRCVSFSSSSSDSQLNDTDENNDQSEKQMTIATIETLERLRKGFDVLLGTKEKQLKLLLNSELN